MPEFSLADILGAQAGAPGPVYEGGPTGSVRAGDVLAALGLGGPSWLDRAQQQTGRDVAAYQQGGMPALMADRGETADLAGGFGGTTTPAKGIRAYHGSPYDFDKFDLSKIGTGEGAQVRGHGFYFAENPAVAREYRKNLSQYQWGDASEISKLLPDKYRGSNDAARRMIDDVLKFEGDPKDYLNHFDVQPDLIPAYQKAVETVGSKGKMYEVNINAKPEQFLDWDKSLRQQPPDVRSAFDRLRSDLYIPFADKTVKWNEPSGFLYGNTAEAVGGPEKATQLLQGYGIPGIKYLDQGSRGTGQGTSNYVVFNPDIIDILKKYGLAGLTMGGVLQAQSESPPQ